MRKQERKKCSYNRDITLLSVIEKIYGGILVDRVRKVTACLIDDEQGGFRGGRECVNHPDR